MENNNLTGSIPESVSTLASLSVLHLGGNKLLGAVPSSLGAAISLRDLRLSGNRMSGTLPAQLSALLQLTYDDAEHWGRGWAEHRLAVAD